MKRIVLFLFLFSILRGEVLAVKEIDFEVTDSNRTWEIGRDKTYDYSPSVLKEANGETKIYTCGGGIPGDPYVGHDAIYLTIFNQDGVKTLDQKRVLSPLISNEKSDDTIHACAPTVIKHSFAQLEGGKEKYLMYYECAPIVYRRAFNNIKGDIFTQTCVAFSDDGISWQKYNENIWVGEHRFANENEPPTPVIKLNQLMIEKYDIQKTDGVYSTGALTQDINAYGVGHPTALVRDGQIWLYYYDSVGEWGKRGTFLAKSDDGFHFYPAVKIDDIKSPPGEIKYIESPINEHPGFYIYLNNGFYNYSWDGIHWAWKEVDDQNFYDVFLTNNYSMKQPPLSGMCGAPGGWAIAADKFGTANFANVDVFTNEGKRGISDQCTATNGCTCYSPLEDQSRGYTWQTYRYKGKFVSMIINLPGDFDNNNVVNLADFGFWKSKYLSGQMSLTEFAQWKMAYLVN